MLYRLPYTPRSLKPSDVNISRYIKLSVIKIMACCLFGAQPLCKPMLDYFLLETREHFSMTIKTKYNIFYTRKYIWKYHPQDGGHIVSASGPWIRYIGPCVIDNRHELLMAIRGRHATDVAGGSVAIGYAVFMAVSYSFINRMVHTVS